MSNARDTADNARFGKNNNMIINGGFRIWQRGTSFTSAASDYTADRWRYSRSTAAVVDISQQTDSNSDRPFSQYLELEVTTADTSLGTSEFSVLHQLIEGYNCEHANFGFSNAETVTLSFWSNHSVTGTHSIAVRNSDNSRSYVSTYTQAAANVWQLNEITIPGDVTGTWGKDSGIGIEIVFAVALGSQYLTSPNVWNSSNFLADPAQVNNLGTIGNKMRFGNVQLEIGNAASDFDFRSFPEELAMCQRYYEKSYAMATSPAAITQIGMSWFYVTSLTAATRGAGHSHTFAEAKRTTPTITMYSPTTGTAGQARSFQGGFDTAATTNDISESTFRWFVNVAGQSAVNVGAQWVADSEL